MKSFTSDSDSNYEKLNSSQTSLVQRFRIMSPRTPSFIVVGLVIIMFLLGFFYMSCSSKNAELRMSIEQFEERIRSLTVKHSEAEKNIESISSRKRELEEEKLTIQRQMEKKDSEINDLNTKLNERISEVQSLKSDKTALAEQIKDVKSLGESIASKNSLIEKLQQQLNNLKQENEGQLAKLKQELESYKINSAPKTNGTSLNQVEQNSFQIPPQRFAPLLVENQTKRSFSDLFRNHDNQLNNLTREIKPQIVPAGFDGREKPINALNGNENGGLTTTTLTSNLNDNKNQQEIGQNVPAPPLANIQNPDHPESAQVAPKHSDLLNANNNNAIADSQPGKHFEQSLKHAIRDENQHADINNNNNNNNNHIDIEDDNQQQNNVKFGKNIFVNDNVADNPQRIQSPRSFEKNYRIKDRSQIQLHEVIDRKQENLDNEKELNDDEDDDAAEENNNNQNDQNNQ